MADPEARPKIRWDESKAESFRATAAQVKADRHEFMLLFGTHLRSEDGGVHVSLNERVVISPFVAKRLLTMIENVIEQYESAYGSIDERGVPKVKEQAKNLLGLPPFRFHLTVERVTSFFQLVSKLRLRVALECSFKLSERILLGGRFLVGIKKATNSQDTDAKMVFLCEKMGMPTKLLNDFCLNLARANVIGFGFGENETGCIVKVYLEFDNPRGSASLHGDGALQPYLCHLGFKWDASDNSRSAVTSYTRFPALAVEEMQGRVAASSLCNPETVGLVRDVIELAARKTKGAGLFYTEVIEGDSSRSSFDINMYGANLLMRDVHPFFLKMCALYSIPQYEFDRLYDPVKNQIFGHLAGGMGRNGEDFLTVYYGD